MVVVPTGERNGFAAPTKTRVSIAIALLSVPKRRKRLRERERERETGFLRLGRLSLWLSAENSSRPDKLH